MLESMTIDNVALIEHTEINFSNGFTVLTGETGAGKSILIGSINMMLGERVSKDLIRHGAQKARVQGVFYITEEKTLSYLSENGFETEDGRLIVCREVSVDGKSTCRIGGSLIPAAKLRELGRYLMNVHGQHDNQALLDTTTHLGFLDRFADAELYDVFPKYQEKYKQYLALKKELSALSMDESEKLRRLDILNYEIEELESADLKIGEEAELKQKSKVLANAQKLLSSSSQALDLLYGNAEGVCAYNYLASAQQLLSDVARMDETATSFTENAEQVLIAVSDIARELQNYLDGFETDDGHMELIQERLDEIYRLKRKYGGEEKDLLAYLENSQKERDMIEMSDERRLTVERELKQVLFETEQLAKELTLVRRKASEKLAHSIGENLSFLNMPGAEFYAEIGEQELSSDGADKVEFMLSANRGEPPKPLAKIVSGGELSRIMLAIQSVLSKSDVAQTLIFDEIDTGVSGRAAQRIGEKLQELSKDKQVLCVTHLAQIAAKASQHFLIDKIEVSHKTATNVYALDERGKIEELSRIIGGETVTETTKKQAEEMLHGK